MAALLIVSILSVFAVNPQLTVALTDSEAQTQLYGAIQYYIDSIVALKGERRCCDQVDQQGASIASLQSQVQEIRAKLVAQCPVGFTYNSNTKTCYMIDEQLRTWSDARKNCAAKGGQLLKVDDATEDAEVKSFLAAFQARPGVGCKWGTSQSFALAISGQRSTENDCKTPFVWKPLEGQSFPLTYSLSWAPGQPDCASNAEACISYWNGGSQPPIIWNDYPCGSAICSICEANPAY